MEDESDGKLAPKPVRNGELSPQIPSVPDVNVPVVKGESVTAPEEVKVNGESSVADNSSNDQDSSDCDALVIDESVNRKKIKIKRTVIKPKSNNCGFKGFSKAKQKSDKLSVLNPFFNESLSELSDILNGKVVDDRTEQGFVENNETPSECTLSLNSFRKCGKTKGNNPKLREYAQYLGLQPTVQFKCSKCGRSGFSSLLDLNEHHMHCTAEAPVVQTSNDAPSQSTSTNFRVTRKVYLCSACGTYYENWNLFLHMREVHKRFICLYCLGMFSVSEKLAQHLILKHGCIPGRRNSKEDFFEVYKDPCCLMCCDCECVFNEQDNFFGHECVGKQRNDEPKKNAFKINKTTKLVKNQVEHVTGDLPSTSGTTGNQTEQDLCDEVNIIQEKSVEASENDCVSMETEETSQLSSDNQNEIHDNVLNEELNISEPEETKEKVEPDLNDIEANKNIEENIKNSEEDSEVPPPVENLVEYEKREEISQSSLESVETRKVPKVTLKLPKINYEFSQEDSNDSDKLNMDIDYQNDEILNKESSEIVAEPQVQVAGPDISIVELELEQPLDKFDIKLLLQKCLTETIPTCIYCNHAKKIAVCGKQLGLHAIAEHRFSAVVNSITAEELIPESFVSRITDSLDELEKMFFNLESSSCEEAVTFSHNFECFQCRFSTAIHKELYLHNRKSHAKTILLCIMCKSNFYSYSELICHLCPGIYAPDNDVQFRCCMCVSDTLPSAFRLMVHLRKRHNMCDVCFELCHNQAKLSNHVWKHKLHHLCYRCGIAYRNKPDITKHLFWKHGTESVLCKKCLQKKWPHVYHFCIPPSSFLCEECSLTFTKAVSLKVHKRIHTDTKPHSCTIDGCTESFISKKLLLKHEFKHREPQEEPQIEEKTAVEDDKLEKPTEDKEDKEEEKLEEEKPVEKPKPKVDLYDLPALNLSESDSSDSETEISKSAETPQNENEEVSSVKTSEKTEEITNIATEEHHEKAPVLENIWDDFKNYQANIGKLDTILVESVEEPPQEKNLLDIIMQEHDYYIPESEITEEIIAGEAEETPMSMDHDYCSPTSALPPQKTPEPKPPTPDLNKKKTLSNSSSDSDSSSCTCGSNCSCSSSSGSSSSSSDSSDSDSSTSEGRRKQQARREKRKERQKTKGKDKNKETVTASVNKEVNNGNQVIETVVPIQESDLETTESETDEDFYDEQPQKLANKLLAEKREKLLADLGPVPNGTLLDNHGPPTPSLPEEETKPRKKSKSKKRKKKKSKYEQQSSSHIPNNNYQFYQTPTVAPITLTLSRNSPITTVTNTVSSVEPSFSNNSDIDPNLRASKRRRVPNKFYGYSSEEEPEKQHPPQPKWRKSDANTSGVSQASSSPLLVPPITIKTVQPQQQMTVEPISIRTSQPGELRVHRPRPPMDLTNKMKDKTEKEHDSGTESNDSSSDEAPMGLMLKPNQPALYCYCRCPYDEVSEMIGCDSSDCAIEWFHFECVGIMVPPKGQWFCPDCRKRKQQKRDMLMQQT